MQKRILSLILAFTIASIAVPARALPRDELVAKLQAGSDADAAAVLTPAARTLRGVVDRVDERNDTLMIRLAAGRTEPFKVQDGLIFNAVRFGDPVEISVQTISGFPTIVGLTKQ